MSWLSWNLILLGIVLGGAGIRHFIKALAAHKEAERALAELLPKESPDEISPSPSIPPPRVKEINREYSLKRDDASKAERIALLTAVLGLLTAIVGLAAAVIPLLKENP